MAYRPPLTPAQATAIRIAYANKLAGWSRKTLAAAYGVRTHTVRAVLERRGAYRDKDSAPCKKCGRKPCLTLEQAREIRAAYDDPENSLSQHALAIRYGVSNGTIVQVLSERGAYLEPPEAGEEWFARARMVLPDRQSVPISDLKGTDT